MSRSGPSQADHAELRLILYVVYVGLDLNRITGVSVATSDEVSLGLPTINTVVHPFHPFIFSIQIDGSSILLLDIHVRTRKTKSICISILHTL